MERYYDLIKKPLITEKTMALMEEKKYINELMLDKLAQYPRNSIFDYGLSPSSIVHSNLITLFYIASAIDNARDNSAPPVAV